jgi:uncharacterized membrane protein YhhN
VPAVPVAAALLIAAGAVAIVDWWAVAGGRRVVELCAKPLTMALLVGVAATAGDPDADVRAWLVAGAVLGLAGDIALLGNGEAAFMAGLGAFALGHLAYTIAAVRVGFDSTWALVGVAFMTAMIGYRFATRTVPGARRRGGPALAGAVVCYACVIAAMVVTAWGTTAVLAGIGAMAFAASDWVLGHERFVGPLPGGRMSVMVPYHVGQAMLVFGLSTA